MQDGQSLAMGINGVKYNMQQPGIQDTRRIQGSGASEYQDSMHSPALELLVREVN